MKKRLLISSLIFTLIFVTLLFSSCSFLLTGLPTDTDSGDNSQSITDAYINEKGELIITYSNGITESLGVVVGQDGKDGKDGIDGENGTNGVDGINGQNGKDGATVIVGEGSELAMSIASCIQSSVVIQCGFKTSYTSMTSDSFSGGSGVIYSHNKLAGDAIIITNYHVVHKISSITENGISDDISVYLYGSTASNQAIEATYIGGSATYDLAVLKISNSDMIKNAEIKSINIRNSGEMHVGDTAIAIGNPEASGFSVSSGIISVDSETIEMDSADGTGVKVNMRVMRIDTPVNSGNSGGGLFDSDGNLIGIVNAKIMASDVDNIAYAIPSSTMSAVVDNILYHCQGTDIENVRRALLGVTVTITNPYSKYNTETGYVDLYESCTVYEVPQTGLAYGKLEVGDIIKEIHITGSTEMSAEITRQYKMLDILLYARAGDTVILTVDRNGELLDIEFTITDSCIVNS